VPDLELLTRCLARNLRHWRRERGHSIDALAARAGVSRGMLIQIEQARTNPSVGTLCKVADALGVSVAKLLDYDQGPRVQLTTADRAVPLWQTEQGSTGILHGGIEAPGPLEVWAWRLEPGDGHSSDPHPRGSAEIIRVEAGELTLTVEGEEYRVPTGTTAGYLADVPHGYRNDGPETVRLTMVVSIPPPS
jgi:transcriptional regulator with XRE-family HTH domain